MSKATKLDQLAERHARRAELLRLLREMASDDAEFVVEAANAALDREQGHADQTPHTNGTATKPVRLQTRTTSFDAVLQWFEDNGNRWATVNEVVDALGMNRNTVSHTIYHAKREYFEEKDDENGHKVFRVHQSKGDADEE